MTRQQQAILAVVAALAIFIGVGITLLVTSGDGRDVTIDTTTTSAAPTSTSQPPATAPTSTAPTTLAPSATIAPGTTTIVPPPPPPTTRAPAPTTTAPATTTTERPTTTSEPATTTTTVDRRTDVGITDEHIRLAVIADDSRTFQGMRAWQRAVNRRDGLADRRVRLDLLETGGTAEGYAEAVRDACDRDFAIVGSFSVHAAAAEEVGCAVIPDLPVEPVAGDHATASNTFAAFPRQPGIEAVGPLAWLLDEVPGCCAQFVLLPETDPARALTQAKLDAAVAAGFTTTGTAEVTPDDEAARYTEIVDEIEASGATFATSGLGSGSTVLLRQAAEGRAPDVSAWFCDARCYEDAFLSDGGDAVEGQYVAIETVPLSERGDVPPLRRYVRVTQRADDEPSYPGLRAYVTGMLFEQATGQVVEEHGDNGLTRARLLEALGGIHDFRAGGIVGSTDVSGGTPTGCSVLLQVTEGAFERVDPAEDAALACGPENLVELGE